MRVCALCSQDHECCTAKHLCIVQPSTGSAKGWRLLCAGGTLVLRFEPLLLHAECADLAAARLLLHAARAAGFRESGATFGGGFGGGAGGAAGGGPQHDAGGEGGEGGEGEGAAAHPGPVSNGAAPGHGASKGGSARALTARSAAGGSGGAADMGRVMVGVRCALRLEAPVAHGGQMAVSDEHVR